MATQRMDLFGSSKKVEAKEVIDTSNLPPTKIDRETGRKLYLNKITGKYE